MKAQIDALLERAKTTDAAEANEPDLDVPAGIERREMRLKAIALQAQLSAVYFSSALVLVAHPRFFLTAPWAQGEDMVEDDVVVPPEDNTKSPWPAWPGTANVGPTPKCLSLLELEELCDDPARDLPGGVNVRAVLTLYPDEGFYLSACDGNAVYQITDLAGQRIRFRTIEAALATLQNLPGLSPDIGLLQAPPLRQHH